MISGRHGAMALVAFGLTAAAPGPVDLARLSVVRDVKAGLWTHSFTTIPKNPAVPNQQEKACISTAQLQAMMRESLSAGPNEERCPISVQSDTMTRAAFTLNCPAVTIPQLGISAPGGNIPGEIIRSPGQEHWVVTMRTPAVSGVTPAAAWRHEYRRLGACPG